MENKKRIHIDQNDDTDRMPKKKKRVENSLYKQPTVEELNQLRETENLFHSNLFRLQIEEVLNAIRIKKKYKRYFDIWFEKLKISIESLEETDEFKIVNENIEDTLKIFPPMPNVPQERKGEFRYLKPSNISVIGSYSFDCTIGPTVAVDIMVEMPAKLFHKLDYQNYRYFKKKALYLAYISSVVGHDLAESKMFIGNNLRPLLKIVPTGKLSKKMCIYLHISAEESSFKLNRFLPEKNSVRPGFLLDHEDLEDDTLLPTPYYNSIVLHDLTMSRTNNESIQIIKEYPNIRDGIILLKIWLKQRQLIDGFDAFSGHIMTKLVLYLLHIRKLNTYMSSYQITRNVWNYLAQLNWCKEGITMGKDDDSQEQVLKYHKYYDCVFLDSSCYHNITAHLSKNTFCWVQREAHLCLKYLEDVHINSFQSLFMKKIPFYMAFDHLICLQDTEALQRVIDARTNITDKLNYGSDKRTQLIKIVVEVLKEGLGNRVRQLSVLPGLLKTWECTERAPDNIGNIFIGLELNPEFSFGIVDKGPEANLPEAADFRKFWGTKSELRRFQDGSIREAVVWGKGETLSEKRIICKKITTFLLEKKLNFSKSEYIYFADQVEKLLKLQTVQFTHFTYGTGEEATLRVIHAFDSLTKNLMSLTDMPLTITGVHGSSPVFRYTEVFPPLARAYTEQRELTQDTQHYQIFKDNAMQTVPLYVHPLEVSLQLSTSGKWPEELEAIKKTKAAFYIQIAECLRKQCNLQSQGNLSHVDVFKEGFVFRLKIAHQKEIALLKRITEDGVIKYRDNEESIELENRLFHLPKLTSALHGLYSQQPTFGAACCLMKRWLSAHLLDKYHMPDIVVELLIASMYLIPHPYTAAQMPQVAFFRVLEMFAKAQWNTNPVIVNFNNEMSKETILAVENLFGTSRDTLPALFISTPYDQQKSIWTKKAPTLLILNRISMLAQEALKLFENQIVAGVTLNCKPSFKPALSEYDCLIHLNSAANPRKLQAVDISKNSESIHWHPYQVHEKQKILIVDFDPVQCYLKELRDGYDEFALFFHDTYGGAVIGVLLKPMNLASKDFKISNVHCRKLNKDSKLTLNIAAMIQDFYILGKGLVQAIDVPTKRLSLS